MKKTIITLLALAGVAVGEEVAFDTQKSITLSEATILGSHSGTYGWNNINSKNGAATMITNLLDSDGFENLGVSGEWNVFVGKADKTIGEGDYSFAGGVHFIKQAESSGEQDARDTQGTMLTYTLNVSELFSSVYPSDCTQSITSVTITTGVSGTPQDNHYTVFTISADGTVACLTSQGVNGNNLATKKEMTFSDLSLGADDKIMVLYREGGKTTGSTITSLSFSASGIANIPEPATATLSLLALAGLAARRRRK